MAVRQRKEIISQISLTQKFTAGNSHEVPLTEISIHLRTSTPAAYVLPKQSQLGFANPNLF